MTIEPAIQAQFERNLTWERSWPKCFLALLATVEIILGLVSTKKSTVFNIISIINSFQAIIITEIFNILVDFWHTNVFGGIWASIILFVNWILIFVTGLFFYLFK